MSRGEALAARAFLVKRLALFGILIKPSLIPAAVKTLVKQREHMRGEKKFAEADVMRRAIERTGYTLEDTPLGPLITVTPISHS